jgi:hypothetical protein
VCSLQLLAHQCGLALDCVWVKGSAHVAGSRQHDLAPGRQGAAGGAEKGALRGAEASREGRAWGHAKACTQVAAQSSCAKRHLQMRTHLDAAGDDIPFQHHIVIHLLPRGDEAGRA